MRRDDLRAVNSLLEHVMFVIVDEYGIHATRPNRPKVK